MNKDFFYKELHAPQNQAALRVFATDKKVRTMVVARIDKATTNEASSNNATEETKVSANAEDGEGLVDGSQAAEEMQQVEIQFNLKVQHLGINAHSIAFVKREPYQVLDLKAATSDNMRHLSSQLQILNLGYVGEDSNLFELAVNYVEYSLIPLFNTYRTSSGKSGEDKANTGLDNVKKDLVQLKVHLNQCLQNLEIPEIELMIDPAITFASEKAKSQGRGMKEEDFIGLAGNTEFVNRLEGCVKQWLKDIARVTQMKYDLTSGSVLQEIMFHISLERSLTHIKEQIEKPEVKTTFDLLKGADKNKLILMFTHDLELDSVLKTVQGYNRVLREVPINNLLSANDLAQINVALTKIFEQVRNMKNQEQIYPKPRQL